MNKQMCIVPDNYAIIGNLGSALKATMAIWENMAESELARKEQETIALSSAEANYCDYCLLAHAAAGKMKVYFKTRPIYYK